MKRLLLLVALVLAAVSVSPGQARADANTPPINSAYNHRIIDDHVFSASGTMGAADIQAFLNNAVPNCRAGYTCLKGYVDPSVGLSAAQIIDTVAKRYNVNPRVILATLQKEQSLVTDTYPYDSQYRSAMGYGCPESQSTCNAQYYGLYNQINLGTKLLRVGTDRNCGNFGSYAGWWINPKWALGQSPIVDGRATYVGTCATGSFFNYTPHRPDSAWIAYNGTYYYGNYNFISIFNRWFGSTWGAAYGSQYVSHTQSAQTVAPGQAVYVTVTFRNTGNVTWQKDGTSATPVRLGASNPLNRGSLLAGGTGWVTPGRVVLDQPSVAPGQNGSFTFALNGNAGLAGLYHEHFRPLAEGVAWMDDNGVYFPVSVGYPGYHATVVDKQVPADFVLGQGGWVTVRYRNTGTSTWARDGVNPVRLGTDGPQDRISAVTGSGWLSGNRIPLQEAAVAPGQVGTFLFQLNSSTERTITENFKPVAENAAWMNTSVQVTTEAIGTFDGQFVGMSGYPKVLPGQSATVWLDVRNTGTATWTKTGKYPVRLGTDNPADRPSALADGWLAANRPGQLVQDTVAPGAVGRFQFSVKPSQAGYFREYLRPLAEGRTWFGPSHYWFVDIDARVINSAQITGYSGAAVAVPGQIVTGYLEYQNTGTTTWTRDGANPMRLGTSNPLDRASEFTSNWLAPNRIQMEQASVAPGQTARFSFQLKAPGRIGTFREYFRPVIEGVSWLEDFGAFIPITVTN